MTHPAQDSTHLIEADAVNCGYAKVPVLRDISFSLAPGQIHGLIGANGTGKTTLLRTLAGQLRATGELSVFGQAPFDNPQVMDRAVLAGIDAPLPNGWSARRLFAIGAARHPGWNPGRAQDLLERFELPAATSYSQLSRGQKSALSIVYAFAAGCELVLLDEPYLGLDVQKRALFYEVLAEQMQQAGTTIVLSTHHLHEVERLLDTVLYLGEGKVKMNGPIDELAETVIEVAGGSEEVDRVLGRLGITEAMVREQNPAGVRVLLDLRSSPATADAVYDTAAQVSRSVRVGEVTLEQAVLALSGDGA